MSLLTYLPFLLTVWLLVLSFFSYRLYTHYNSFIKETEKKSLISALNELLKATKDNQKAITEVNKRLDLEVAKGRKHFKRFAFKRFNPFTDTGGDQSFILVLLDENNDGFVISSLHSRENTRIYGKKLINAKAQDQVLSKEEQLILAEALKS